MLHSVGKMLGSDIAIIVYEVCFVIFLIIILIKILRKQKAKEELQGISRSKMRDDELKGALENNYAPEILVEESTSNIPYEVRYHDSLEKKKETLSIQLIERNALSERKYMFNIETLIRIGKQPQNDIVLKDAKAVPEDAQIIRRGRQVYLKKVMSSSTLCLQRGKKVIPIEEKLLELNSGDILLIGETRIDIRIL